MTRALRAAVEFVVGDDWLTAAGVAVGIGLTALLVAAGANAWWMMPIAVVGVLVRSLRRSV